VRTIVRAASICLCVLPSAASAADWSLRSTLSESVEFNDNQFLSTPAHGSTVSSYSSITSNGEARTATSKFDFDSNVNYRKYWGPGTEGLPQTENVAYGFTGHYETFGKNSLDRNFIESSFSSQSSAFALLNQLGVLSPVNGAIDQLTFRGGFDRALSARDTISVNAQSTRTFYDPSGTGTAFTDTSAGGTWQRRLNGSVILSASSQAESLSYENTLGTNVLILRNQGGIDVSLSPLLSFRGSAGAAYVKTENGVNTLTSVGGSGSGSLSSSSVGFITDMLVTYRALRSTTFTLAATQTVGPTIVGSLFQVGIVRAGMTQIINSKSSVSLAADVSRAVSTNTTDFASASVTYSRELTREWNAQISYRHLHRFGSSGSATFDPITGTPILSGTGPADSNSLLVVVSKSMTILPHSN
jgi:hypothetical protein